MDGRNVIRKIIFIIGFLICIYPLGSSIIESFYQREAIATYENAVNNIDRAELELEYNKAEEYSEKLNSIENGQYNRYVKKSSFLIFTNFFS